MIKRFGMYSGGRLGGEAGDEHNTEQPYYIEVAFDADTLMGDVTMESDGGTRRGSFALEGGGSDDWYIGDASYWSYRGENYPAQSEGLGPVEVDAPLTTGENTAPRFCPVFEGTPDVGTNATYSYEIESSTAGDCELVGMGGGSYAIYFADDPVTGGDVLIRVEQVGGNVEESVCPCYIKLHVVDQA